MKKACNKFIYYIVTIALLLTGMCLDDYQAGSSFSCHAEEHAAFITHSAEDTLSSADSCTSEILGQQETLSSAYNTRRVSEGNSARTSLSLAAVQNVSQRIFFAPMAVCMELRHCNFSNTVILSYIHHIDGKK